MRATENVSDSLALRPMGEIEDAPPTLSFDRPRSLSLPWLDFANATNTDESKALAEAARIIRQDFERSWGLDGLQADIPRDLLEAVLVTQSNNGDVLRFAPLQPDEAAGFPDGKGIFAKHGSSRWYRLLFEEEIPLESFKQDYSTNWKKVVGTELVKETGAGIEARPTITEQIDLRAPFIEARYKELIVMRDIAAATHAAAKQRFSEAVSKLAPTDDEEDDYTNTGRKLDWYEAKLRALSRQAAEMGYSLFVAPTPSFPPKDPPDEPKGPTMEILKVNENGTTAAEPQAMPVEYGRLYKRTVETRTYTPTFTTTSFVGYLWRLTTVIIFAQLPPVTKEVAVMVEVDTLREKHRERIAELQNDGYDVHVLIGTENGYENSRGLPLEMIMSQCSADETTRLKTAVFLPSYDFKLTGERVLTGYMVFLHPAAGMMPIAFPELYVRESMEYRTTWISNEVGELVKTINLAPGEHREVTVTRTFQQETTETKSASSVFDLASTESSDLATEMERSARNETDIATKVSATASASHEANAEVSASYNAGPFAGAAKAGYSYKGSSENSASYDKSVKKVGTDLAKSAQRAARSVNESRKEEVSSSSTSRTSISTSDSSVSIIENINTGRTLNLMYYRLYNRFVAKLFLTDLRLTVRSGTELIAGSGILPQRTYSIHELSEVVEELSKTPLPMHDAEDKAWEFRLAILRQIGDFISKEYTSLTSVEDDNQDHDAPMLGATIQIDTPERIFSFSNGLEEALGKLREMPLLEQITPPPSESSAPQKGGDPARVSELERSFNEIIANLTKELEQMEASGLPVNSTNLLVASEGLFMDAQVGTNPATEPYFEKMREAEIGMKWAEVDRIRSEADRNRALADHMSIGQIEGAKTVSVKNTVMQINTSKSSIEVVLAAPLEVGDWKLEYDKQELSGKLDQRGSRALVLHFETSRNKRVPSWVANGTFDALELVDQVSGKRLSCANALVDQG